MVASVLGRGYAGRGDLGIYLFCPLDVVTGSMADEATAHHPHLLCPSQPSLGSLSPHLLEPGCLSLQRSALEAESVDPSYVSSLLLHSDSDFILHNWKVHSFGNHRAFVPP